jgi:hypothetical protein
MNKDPKNMVKMLANKYEFESRPLPSTSRCLVRPRGDVLERVGDRVDLAVELEEALQHGLLGDGSGPEASSAPPALEERTHGEVSCTAGVAAQRTALLVPGRSAPLPLHARDCPTASAPPCFGGSC